MILVRVCLRADFLPLVMAVARLTVMATERTLRERLQEQIMELRRTQRLFQSEYLLAAVVELIHKLLRVWNGFSRLRIPIQRLKQL